MLRLPQSGQNIAVVVFGARSNAGRFMESRNLLNWVSSKAATLFAASRISGWSAHVIEQLEHNRLIRPRGRYTGPEEKHVTPIAERG